MATEIETWQIIDGKLSPTDKTLSDSGRTEPYDLESWIVSHPSVVANDLVIIGRQVKTKSGPLDLLGIDRNGNTVIVELKRDTLPRDALAQAIDYASDVADWSIDRLSETCAKYTGSDLETTINDHFSDFDADSININETQRIILIGFAIEESLERMVSWLSNRFGVSINAVVLKYVRTTSGDELLVKTSIIPEEVEQERIRKRKFQIAMSDEPGTFPKIELESHLHTYLSSSLWSARRIRNVLLPECMEHGKVTRDELKEAFVERGEADNLQEAGRFLSLVSQQIGMEKNSFLRQVIDYGYPNHPWEKDDYSIRDEFRDVVVKVLDRINSSTDGATG